MIDSNAPLPWIGAYAAAAALIWDVALVADIVHSVRGRKLWFPCRYSSLNAASLTLLSVAVKFAMDLTTEMRGGLDQYAKISSAAFLCTSTSHFMLSLGSMSDRDILVNLAALGILLVTLVVNLMIQVSTGVVENWMRFKAMVFVFLGVYLPILLGSFALTIHTSKRYLEEKYNELRTRISGEELKKDDRLNFDKLKLCVKKYWVMAETGNPQFVMARSETSAILLVICFASYLFGFGSLRQIYQKLHVKTESDYKWSVYLVYWFQYVGLLLCLVISLGRFLVALIHTVQNVKKWTVTHISLEIHNYRIKSFVEWKKGPPPLRVRGQKLRKIIFNLRNSLLNICIGSQIVIVIINKLLVPITFFGFILGSAFHSRIHGTLSSTYLETSIVVLIILLFSYISRNRIIRCLVMLWKKILGESDEMLGYDQDIRNFVLLLDSEVMPDGYLRFINTSINSSIMVGSKHQPRYLMELLENSTSFNGVLKFESEQVPPIICQQSPDCWSLSVATLTTIMISLPNIQNEKRNQFLQSVAEGFKFVRLVEKSLDVHKNLVSCGKVAEYAWVVAELRRKWLDIDLKKIAKASQSSKETFQSLSCESEKILTEFVRNGNVMEGHVNLPENIIIANSMYKLSNTLLLEYDDCYNLLSDAEVFENLGVIVADIFAACLTNLPDVILMKCSNSSIEEREKSIQEATHLLGETQHILKNLQKRDIPSLPPKKSVYMEEWHAILERTNHDTSSNEVPLDILNETNTEEASEIDEDNVESHVSRESGEEKA